MASKNVSRTDMPQARFTQVNGTGELLNVLWSVAAAHLTFQEMRAIAYSGEDIATELSNLTDGISSTGCLVSGDHHDTPGRTGALDDSSTYLFSIASNLEAISAAQRIVSDAAFRVIEMAAPAHV